jgi:hypothetical protein
MFFVLYALIYMLLFDFLAWYFWGEGYAGCDHIGEFGRPLMEGRRR